MALGTPTSLACTKRGIIYDQPEKGARDYVFLLGPVEAVCVGCPAPFRKLRGGLAPRTFPRAVFWLYILNVFAAVMFVELLAIQKWNCWQHMSLQKCGRLAPTATRSVLKDVLGNAARQCLQILAVCRGHEVSWGKLWKQ